MRRSLLSCSPVVWSSSLALLALACDPGRRLDADLEEEHLGEAGAGAKPISTENHSSYGAIPEVGEAGNGANTDAPTRVVDAKDLPPSPLALGPEAPLGEIPVVAAQSGAWESRRAGGSRGMGGPTAVSAPLARPSGGAADLDAVVAEEAGSELLGDTVGTTDGFGGLGIVGTGSGGGGTGEGLGGLGTKGMGSGSGYGAPKAKPAHARDMPSSPPAPEMARQVSPLRAGSTDDNAAFDSYLQFLATWSARQDMAGRAERLDPRGKRLIQVLDGHGRPLPGARVDLVDTQSGTLAWSAHTTGDGRVPFYPALELSGVGKVVQGQSWTVVVRQGGQEKAVRWDGGGNELDIQLPVYPEPERGVPVDVCFIIDTTGSMGDEIGRVQDTLLSLTQRLRSEQEVDLRYSAVLYRDIGDEYLTMVHPFTNDFRAFDTAIQQISAGGGGDGPESLNQGLAMAVAGVNWRPGAAKVAFLIADAPPHMDYQESITYGRAAAGAVHQGIRVHTVAASGLDDVGSLVFRQIAQLTRGRFIFIEYGSTAAAAADHGVAGPVRSNNLDQILYDRIDAEIKGWRRDDLAVATR